VSTSGPRSDARAVAVSITDRDLVVDLADGRRISAPLAWYPRLARAAPDQRRNWRLMGDGVGIHWPDVDEDLSVDGLLRGQPAPGASKRTV
jgi:hypothetical protein